jgi:hypothetical protein
VPLPVRQDRLGLAGLLEAPLGALPFAFVSVLLARRPPPGSLEFIVTGTAGQRRGLRSSLAGEALLACGKPQPRGCDQRSYVSTFSPSG